MKTYVNLCTFFGKDKGKRTSTVSETKWLFKEKITLIRLPEKKTSSGSDSQENKNKLATRENKITKKGEKEKTERQYHTSTTL